MRKVVSILLIALLAPLFTGCASTSPERNEYFSDWPAGTSPAEIGKRVAENFVPRKFRWETVPEKASLGIIYPEAITWYGSLTVAQLTHDSDLTDRLIKKFEPYLSEPLSQKVNHSAHVDYRVFGIVPLQIYLENKDKRCLDLGLSLADAQWSKTTPDGITAEARYWIDDMYMITAVQTQAYRATGDMKYLDRAALAMSAYLDRLQQPNGLFFHGTNAPFYWSRGNGWVAAGLTDRMTHLVNTV